MTTYIVCDEFGNELAVCTSWREVECFMAENGLHKDNVLIEEVEG